MIFVFCIVKILHFFSMICFCGVLLDLVYFFFFKQKTAYVMRISDGRSDVCSSDLAVLTLNALDLSFASARLTGADGKAIPLTAATDDATQTVTFTAAAPLAPGKYRLATRYTGTINTQANGLFALDYPDKVSGKEVRGLFTQFEAPDARRFVPSFDEPSYKATFTLAATVPAGDLAVSNMPVASETPVAGGRKTVTFQISPKMSSYLLFFATGNFERLAAKSDSDAEVGIVSPKGSGAIGRAHV